MEFESLEHFKSIATYHFFVVPADTNYLLSRWMLANEFSPDDWWQAAQAIEKYLKGGLVANNKRAIESRKGNGHDLVRLYERHAEVFDGLPNLILTQPPDWGSDYWYDDTVETFLARVQRNGDPNVRYGLLSWDHRRCDYSKLDQLVYFLRRRTGPLTCELTEDWQLAPNWQALKGDTIWAALEKEPQYSPYGPIEKLNEPLPFPGHSRGDILHLRNHAFRRADDDLAHAAPGYMGLTLGAAKNSLFSQWMPHLKAPTLKPILGLGLRWVLDYVRLPKITFTETAPLNLPDFIDGRLKLEGY